MRETSLNRVRLTFIVCLLLAVAACGGTGSSPREGDTGQGDPVYGGTLVDLATFGAAGGDPDHIGPALATTAQASQPGHLLFDGLTDYDYETGALRPAVAESWTSNPEATQWTFKLRRGVTFHNGDEVRPSDFKFAWERLASKALASPVAYHIVDNLRVSGARRVAEGETGDISGLRADDAAGTLSIELEAPLSFVPHVVAHLAFSPVPKRVVEGLPAGGSQWEQGVMVGNGPYRMEEPWTRGQHIKLVRHDDYWGGINGHDGYLDAIEFRMATDADSAFAAFESGQAQTGYVPAGRVGEARARYAGRMAFGPINAVYYWGFNMRDPIVGGPANLKLRQAISLAIDKDQIVESVYSGSREVPSGWTPPVMPGFEEGLGLFVGHELERARELLGEWEAETGRRTEELEPIKLNFGAGAGHDAVALIIQANLKELGVASELDPSDGRTYFARMRRGEGQFFRGGWGADYIAYDNMLFPVFGTSQIGVGDNLCQYSNPKFDRLIEQARRTSAEPERQALYREAERTVLNDDTAAVPLNWYTGLVVWSEQVNNVIQSPLSFLAYDEMWLSGS